ncbi:hypothetical protein pb186bvf_017479 [Paramecium bursaria]
MKIIKPLQIIFIIFSKFIELFFILTKLLIYIVNLLIEKIKKSHIKVSIYLEYISAILNLNISNHFIQIELIDCFLLQNIYFIIFCFYFMEKQDILELEQYIYKNCFLQILLKTKQTSIDSKLSSMICFIYCLYQFHHIQIQHQKYFDNFFQYQIKNNQLWKPVNKYILRQSWIELINDTIFDKTFVISEVQDTILTNITR